MQQKRDYLLIAVLVVALGQMGFNQFLVMKTLSSSSPTVIQLQPSLNAKDAVLSSDGRELRSTGNPLDLFIDGNGYFVVDLPDGTQGYTQDGRFHTDREGKIVDRNGYPFSQSISVPMDYVNLMVDANGVVAVRQPGSRVMANLGQILLVRFMNPDGLRKSASLGVLLETEESGEPIASYPGDAGLGNIMSGYVQWASAESDEPGAIIVTRSGIPGTKVFDAVGRRLK
ncbi:MAG: hypothetical protein WC655_15970 [Candidatus Hydrogenedentales bacterium]|jgi:flagellar basal-body rod protein FlgG